MMVYSKYRTSKTKNSKHRPFPTHIARRIGIFLFSFTTAVLIVLKVATWLYAGDELFTLREVKIVGNNHIETEELLALVSIDSAQGMFDIDLRKISRAIETHDLVAEATAIRRLPSTIIITVLEREPLALLNRSELMAVDENGYLMTAYKPKMLVDYPIISDLAAGHDSDLRSRHMESIIGFLRFAKRHDFRLYSMISEISYSHKYGLYFNLLNASVPVIIGSGDYFKKSDNFKEVLSFLEAENKLEDIEYFDLRFKDRVIVKGLQETS